MNETEKIVSKPEKIGKRKIKRQQVIADVIDGKLTLKQIGEKHYPNAKYPSQTLSNSVARPAYQKDIAKIVQESLITPEYLMGKLSNAIEETAPKQAVHSSYLQLALKTQAMLTDKLVKTENVAQALDISALKPDQLVELVKAIDRVKAIMSQPAGDHSTAGILQAKPATIEAQPSKIDTQPGGGGEDNKA